MPNLWRAGISYGIRAAHFCLVLSLLLSSHPAEADSTPSTRTTIPEPAVLMIMIRSLLAALNHANLTNNYSTLYDLGSSEFRKATTPQRLSDQLKPFRDQALDLSPIFAVTPILDEAPILDSGGTLRLNGHFPTMPLKITFSLAFRDEEHRWRHSGLAVGAEASE